MTMTPTKFSRRSTAPTESEYRRHQRMVRLAFDWMARTGANQQKLVDLINDYWHARGDEAFACDHTLLSRMLHPDAPYVATSRRLKAMQLQEAMLTVCITRHDVNVVQSAGGAGEELTWTSDDEHAFLAHRARLRQLREHGEACASAAFNLMGELVVAVRGLDDRTASNHDGETFRQRGAENLLMTMATLTDRGGTAGVMDHLQQAEGLPPERADDLRRQQLARIEATLGAVGRITLNMHAYAGGAMFHLGQRQRGMLLLLDAVRQGHSDQQRHDPHWETLLELLERLHGSDTPETEAWSEQARAVAGQVLDDREHPARQMLLVRAWARLQLPRLSAAWSRIDPSLTARIGRLVASDAPARPKVSGPARLIGIFAAVLLSLAASWPVMAMPSAAAMDGAEVAYNIRGREARGPSTPPPPQPGGEQPA